MLEIIGKNKYIDFLPDCFDVTFVDKPTGKHKFLKVEDDCHIDAIQLKRCLDEMTNEFAVKLPYLRFEKFRKTGYMDIIKEAGTRLQSYEDIGLIESSLTHNNSNEYNIIYNPLSNNGVVKEFHCDFVMIYSKDL